MSREIVSAASAPSSSTRVPIIHASRLFLLFAVGLVIAGCGAIRSSEDSPDDFWSPFSSQSYWEVGDGRILVELSGYERGHERGKAADFTINIENRREDPAELEICAKLINEREIVQRFEHFTVELDAESSKSTTFSAVMDEELEPRAYGLAVVVGEIGAIVHTIRVGIPDDDAGPWLDAEQLVCD
jgi:hypothetical protein